MIISIPITAAGSGLALLEKSIKTGAKFILEFEKSLECMKVGVNLVNKLFEELGINLRLNVNMEAKIEAVILSTAIGAAAGAGIALLAGFPLFWPVLIGSLFGAAAATIEVESVETGKTQNGLPGVLVNLKN